MSFSNAWKRIQDADTVKENTHQEALPKLPEPPFDSNGSEAKRHVSENREPEALDYDREILDVIAEFDRHGVHAGNTPVEIQREAMRLEDRITEACNDNDPVEFRRALHKWRLAWLRSLH